MGAFDFVFSKGKGTNRSGIYPVRITDSHQPSEEYLSDSKNGTSQMAFKNNNQGLGYNYFISGQVSISDAGG